MQIFFTKHARDKLEVLERHGVVVSQQFVEETLAVPDSLDQSRAPLLFAEKSMNPTHALRVAYKQDAEVNMIITFYPVKRKSDEPGAAE